MKDLYPFLTQNYEMVVSMHTKTHFLVSKTYKEEKPANLGGIIFDLDGTLNIPAIDFGIMRKKLQFTDGDILENIKKLTNAEEIKAKNKIIYDMEREAIEKMQLQPNIFELMTHIRATKDLRNKINEKQSNVAIITRNSAENVQIFLNILNEEGKKNNLSQIELQKKILHPQIESFDNFFSKVISRDDCIPVKPSPAPIHFICEKHFGVEPQSILMIGDHTFDIRSGSNAGSRTCLMLTKPSPENVIKEWGAEQLKIIQDSKPDFIVNDLGQIKDVISIMTNTNEPLIA